MEHRTHGARHELRRGRQSTGTADANPRAYPFPRAYSSSHADTRPDDRASRGSAVPAACAAAGSTAGHSVQDHPRQEHSLGESRESRRGAGSHASEPELDHQGSGKGFLGRLAGGNGIDLDLDCPYEMADGRKGVIQALGEAFGSRYDYPFIELDGDDRTGSVADGENLYIDLSNPWVFKRILIFAYIYEGVPNCAAADGVVTLYRTSGSEIEVRLDSGDNRAPMCAIALLESKNGQIDINREVRYIKGDQSHLDKAYKWGMRWTPGSK